FRRRRRPRSTRFPYTTLFRSLLLGHLVDQHRHLVAQIAERGQHALRGDVLRGAGQRFGGLLNRIEDRSELVLERFAELAENSSQDRKSTRLNSSHVKISYAVF